MLISGGGKGPGINHGEGVIQNREGGGGEVSVTSTKKVGHGNSFRQDDGGAQNVLR